MDIDLVQALGNLRDRHRIAFPTVLTGTAAILAIWSFDALVRWFLGGSGVHVPTTFVPDSKALPTLLVASVVVLVLVAGYAIREARCRREEMRKLEEYRRIHIAYDFAHQFIGVLDPAGRLLEANRTSLEFIGETIENLRGRAFWECAWWDHDEQLQNRLIDAVVQASAGTPDQFEAVHKDPSGRARRIDFRIRPVLDADGRVVFLIPEGHDISDLRAAELEEAKSRRMIQAIMDATPIRVFWKDLAGRYLGCNTAFARDAGLSRAEELIGKTDHDMVWKDQATRFRADDKSVTDSGRDRLGIEEPQTREDGQIYWLRTSKVPLRDGTGAVIGMLGMYEDVTDSRRTREQLETSKQRLLEVNQELERRVQERTADLMMMNRELETFAHSAAHDLRTPLRAIDGWSHAVLEDSAPCLDDTAKQRLGRIRAGAQRIGEILDDLLRLSQASRVDLEVEEVDLARVARELRDVLVGGNPDRAFEWVIADRLPVRGDPGLLRLLLWNLLDNAVKFTVGRKPARIEVGIDERGLFVRDNGTGFDMAHSGKLFKAFQRLHLPEEFAGTGIGLALVRRIAERHGGWVNAEGAPGVGATFHFMLG